MRDAEEERDYQAELAETRLQDVLKRTYLMVHLLDEAAYTISYDDNTGIIYTKNTGTGEEKEMLDIDPDEWLFYELVPLKCTN